MRIVRGFLVLVFLSVIGAGVAYYVAGKADGPTITINQPGAVIGHASPLEITIDTPGAHLSALRISVEQAGRTLPVLALDRAPDGTISQPGPDRVLVRHQIGKKSLPELRSGPAMLTVAAARPVLRGLREVSSQTTRQVQVRLEPPRVAVVSTHHFINLGGSEMVVYRASPADVSSGVRVGDHMYPGFPGTGIGLPDPELRVAFFAMLHDQKPGTPIFLYARDAAGNETRAQFDHRVFPKTFRRSRIEVNDAFLGRVVPAILQQSPELGAQDGDLLPSFLKINRDLRRTNNEQIAALSKNTSPSALWKGAFQSLGGSQVESSFADFRTYVHQGKEIDRQVHLGFDLAKTANAPIAAANDGKVVHAADLGIYGNCVVIDHGMGVQSLYAHLSSFAVREGQEVRKGDTLGNSGQTGLAGGDHLHFSMLVNGQFVNATEWWDPHWIEDRVMRKVRDAGGSVP